MQVKNFPSALCLMTALAMGSLLISSGIAMAPPAQDLLGVSELGGVWKVESANANGTFVGDSGYSQLKALTRDSTGRFYSAFKDQIIEIDSTTGQGTLVVALGLGRSIRALAFDPQDRLFAILEPASSIGTDELHEIIIANASTILIGPTGFKPVEALTWGGGVFWGWDCIGSAISGAGLIQIDPLTGAGTDVNPNAQADCEIRSLSFRDPQQANGLFGMGEVLFEVDPNTGLIVLVGSGAYPAMNGLEFIENLDPIFLHDPVPGTAGVINSISFDSATPQSDVALIAGFVSGNKSVPGCPGQFVSIQDVRFLGIKASDVSGTGAFSGFVKPGLLGVTTLIQAVDLGSCKVSNLVVYTFQ